MTEKNDNQTTTIAIDNDTHTELVQMKKYPRETFNDLIKRMIETCKKSS